MTLVSPPRRRLPRGPSAAGQRGRLSGAAAALRGGRRHGRRPGRRGRLAAGGGGAGGAAGGDPARRRVGGRPACGGGRGGELAHLRRRLRGRGPLRHGDHADGPAAARRPRAPGPHRRQPRVPVARRHAHAAHARTTRWSPRWCGTAGWRPTRRGCTRTAASSAALWAPSPRPRWTSCASTFCPATCCCSARTGSAARCRPTGCARRLAAGDPEKAARRLVDEALRHGGPDNVTAVVVQLLEEAPASRPTRPRRSRRPTGRTATSLEPRQSRRAGRRRVAAPTDPPRRRRWLWLRRSGAPPAAATEADG